MRKKGLPEVTATTLMNIYLRVKKKVEVRSVLFKKTWVQVDVYAEPVLLSLVLVI